MSGFLPSPTKWVLDANRDPPVYTRPMVGSELLMQRSWNAFDGAAEGCMGINFTSSLRLEEMRVRGRRALDKLRFVCPLIACTTEDLGSPRWIYTPSADREAWLDLAFVVEDRGTSLNPYEFVKNMSVKRRYPCIGEDGTTTIFRVHLLATSKKGDNDSNRSEYGLYVYTTHSIMDAGPTLNVLNLMCEWMCDNGMDITIVPSEEWKNLPVDSIVATGGPSQEWERSGTELLQDLSKKMSRFFLPPPALAPPSRPLNMSDPSLLYATTVSESETTAIIALTKRLGISVSALFYAAHGLAQLKINPLFAGPGGEVDFPLFVTSVSLEHYLKPPVNPKTYYASCLSLIPMCFSMDRPLMEHSEKGRLLMTAKKVQEQFDKVLAHPCLSDLMAVYVSRPLQEEHERANVKPRLPPWHCGFQNLGVVENRLAMQYYGKLEVESICFGARVTTFMNVHMWTMHSKFHFQIQGAAAWGEECVKRLLEETVRIGSLITMDAKL
ncbi:hypothetical protein JVU11DRAFT_5636 [Chiua virens]|nr:hypothetical protein JVU11DRAFT_5636 [Chiua virens]